MALHELSMASGILETVLEVASKNNAKKVLEVVVEVGELTLLNPDQLSMAFNVLSEGTIVEGAKLKVKVIRARARCNACNEEWDVGLGDLPTVVDHFTFLTCLTSDSKKFLKNVCPKCGGTDFDFVTGKELVVKSIKIEK
jgi:hydrogenase nickel incorporation protein HypA/HybF